MVIHESRARRVLVVTRWIRRERRGSLQAVLLVRVDGQGMCGRWRGSAQGIGLLGRMLVLVVLVVG